MHFRILDLGLITFSQASILQKEIFNQVKDRALESTLIVCRHNPVITLGRKAGDSNILLSRQQLEDLNIDIQKTERGGDVTYHGPGQLIAYPIFRLDAIKKDINFFLRRLEETVIRLLSDFDIKGLRRNGFTGVWTDNNKKISSMGIAIRQWITFHGLSINVKQGDLANFSYIRPCGMDIRMTSLEEAIGKDIEMELVRDRLIDNFKAVF